MLAEKAPSPSAAWDWLALGLITGGVLLRLALIHSGWPLLNSDEATMGIMARHIADGADRPIFFYGQEYMGAAEAYVAAALFELFGPSAFTLRLGLVLLFGVFLGAMYALARLLYDRRLALLTLAALCLGSEDALYRQVAARGGYPETLLCGALVLVLATWLIVSSGHVPVGRQAGRRYVAFGLCGLMAGAGLWSDLLVAPFVVVAFVGLAGVCWREWKTPALPLLVLGLLVGALPLISWNLTALPGHDSLHVLLAISQTGGTGQQPRAISPVAQIVGTVLVSLPVATGAAGVCRLDAAEAWPLSWHASPHALLCTAAHGAWGLGLVALWLVAATREVSCLWQARRSDPTIPPSRRAPVHLARLMMLASAALIIAPFVHSSAPAVAPWMGARYLTGVLVAAPALLAPLSDRRAGPLRQALGGAFLLVGGVILLSGALAVFRSLPGVGRIEQAQKALASYLPRRQATRIYTDYWTCDRLAFQSAERIACSVLDEHLQPGFNRVYSYVTVVGQTRHPLYVFVRGSPQDVALAGQGRTYRRALFAGYAIYTPVVEGAAPRRDTHGRP